MRIAFLCKRRYMGKDVIDDRYGRLYEMPYQLARLGHEVHGFCLQYGNGGTGSAADDAKPGELTWHSSASGSAVFPWRGVGYPSRLLRQLRCLKPDVVIGGSDIPHVALSAWLARQLRIPYMVDLYDNFEGFGQARLPGFVTMLRQATRRAALVTTTSDALAVLVRETYRAQGPVLSMPSTVDLEHFRPGDRCAARQALGLPMRGELIGTAGGLLANRGISELYAAWETISAAHPDARLVLAGPADPTCPPPAGPRIHYLGSLPHTDTAALFQALDIGVIYLRETTFGRFCFPQKAYEMFACQLPVVAAKVGAMPGLLADVPSALYAPEDPQDLARAVMAQLSERRLPNVRVEDWATLIGRLESALVEVTMTHAKATQKRGA